MHLGPHVAEILAAKGFYVLGFDVKAYLGSFTSGSATLGVGDEPGDYRTLADLASKATSKKPILIGVSEGAGLSVLAATDPRTKAAILGVIGLGLASAFPVCLIQLLVYFVLFYRRLDPRCGSP